MANWFKWFKKDIYPSGLVEEALKHPNGWVYIIDAAFQNDQDVPPQAIKGAWKVNEKGKIEGDFIPNPKYLDLSQSLPTTPPDKPAST